MPRRRHWSVMTSAYFATRSLQRSANSAIPYSSISRFELGLNSKREIEEYGIAEFAERCKERVAKYAEVITDQCRRLGMWMDWDNDYYTFSDTNIEYIWRFLKECHSRNWLY